MSVASVPRREAASADLAKLVAIAIGLAVAGFAIRFLAFRTAFPDAAESAFFEAMCRWDCTWYVRLAEEGYDGFPTPKLVNAGNWAFFPLYPMLVGALHAVMQIPTLPLAAALGTGFGMATAVLASPLLGRDIRAFTLFAAFLLCGPFSIYFTSFFTETLFVFLTVAVFAALDAKRFLLAGALAGALSATRIVGVFIVFALLWDVWRAHRSSGGTLRDFVPAVLRRPDLVLAFALAPLGLFAYMAFLHLQVGDALAFQHVQRAWGRPSGLPPVFIWNGLTSPPDSGWWPTSSQWLAVATVIGYVFTIGLFLTRRTAMGIFALIALTLPLFAGLASMLRFVAGLAPMSILGAVTLGRSSLGFAVGLALIFAGAWFVTLAWLGGVVALV